MEQNLNTLTQLVALLFVITGTLFSMLGILGYMRLPDVYTRLHATGKVGVFGVVLLLNAAVNLSLLGIGKGLVLIFMLMITGPATARAIGSAAYRIGIPMKGAIRDDLNRDIRNRGTKDEGGTA